MRKKPVSLRLDDQTLARGARVGAYLRAHSPSPTLTIHDTDVWIAIIARGLDAWENTVGVPADLPRASSPGDSVESTTPEPPLGETPEDASLPHPEKQAHQLPPNEAGESI